MEDTTNPAQAKHSPLPWSSDKKYPEIINDANACFVGVIEGEDTSTTEDESNTALIIRAVNSHAALVEALGEIAKGEGPFSRHPLTHAENTIEAMKQIATDAISAAKETT